MCLLMYADSLGFLAFYPRKLRRNWFPVISRVLLRFTLTENRFICVLAIARIGSLSDNVFDFHGCFTIWSAHKSLVCEILRGQMVWRSRWTSSLFTSTSRRDFTFFDCVIDARFAFVGIVRVANHANRIRIAIAVSYTVCLVHDSFWNLWDTSRWRIRFLFLISLISIVVSSLHALRLLLVSWLFLTLTAYYLIFSLWLLPWQSAFR